MQAIQDGTEANLGEYAATLRRRWIWVVGAVVVLVGLSLAQDLRQAPVYRSSAQLLLQAKSSENIFSTATQSPDPSRAILNELRIINSRTVRDAVAKAYGKPISVSAKSGGDDDIIILTATDHNPDVAAKKVNVYATTYQTSRLDAIVSDLATAKKAVTQQVTDYQKQIDDLNKPIAALDAQIRNTSATSPEYTQLVTTRTNLAAQTQAQSNDLQSQLNDYQSRLELLNLSERLSTTGGVQILNPATPSSTPIAPTPVRDAIQAALIGMFIGFGLAFLRDQLDDSVRTKADLDRTVRDLPVIGLIPTDPGWRDSSGEHLGTLASPMSATAEAYRSLRTSLQYLSLERPMKFVQITSASAGEGKTSTVANLAIAYAQAGKSVIVVGCDLRKPRVHRFLQVDGTVGLTSVLVGDVPLDEAIQQSPVHPNISVLATGPRPPNPSELLSLDRTAALIRSLGDRYSIVFVDSPPVLPVTDALVLARCVDATLFLAASNRTSRRQVRRGVEMLRQVKSPLVGTVLNGVSAEGTYGSLYEYYGGAPPRQIPIVSRLFQSRKSDIPMMERGVAEKLPERDDATDRSERAEDDTADAGSNGRGRKAGTGARRS